MDHDTAGHDTQIHDIMATHHVGLLQRLVANVLAHPGVAEATAKATAAGVPWGKILAAILPFVMQIFSGGTVDWTAIIAAILALIQPKP